MIGPVKKGIKKHLKEGVSYKIIALLVALVLWATLLGRKNSVLNKDMDLEILVRPTQTITNQIRKKVRVQLSGPRMILKKFTQSNQSYTVDLSKRGPGKHKIWLKKNTLDLPVELKVLSIFPKTIEVRLREIKKGASR